MSFFSNITRYEVIRYVIVLICVVAECICACKIFKSKIIIKQNENGTKINDHITQIRACQLIQTVAIEIILLSLFWPLIDQLFKNSKWLSGIASILFAAGPAYLVWHWRDQNKLKDQEHAEKQLNHQQAIDDRNLFYKFHGEATSGENEDIKAMAISNLFFFFIGKYGKDLQELTLELFRYLSKNSPPKHINKMLNDVIKRALKHEWRNWNEVFFDLSGLYLREMSFKGECFAYCNLSGTDFIDTDITSCNFYQAIFTNTYISCKKNIENICFEQSRFSNTRISAENIKQCYFRMRAEIKYSSFNWSF